MRITYRYMPSAEPGRTLAPPRPRRDRAGAAEMRAECARVGRWEAEGGALQPDPDAD